MSTTSTAATTSTTTAETETSTGGETSGGRPPSGFITVTDAGWHGGLECDPFLQDCRPGHKCAPYSDDGGLAWNATHCVPVAQDPAAVGESCTVEDHAASGIDDCEAGSVCWFLDDALHGECLAQCGGSPRMPTCAEGLACVQWTNGVTTMCLPACDPLVDDCGDDGVCVPRGDGFVCWSDGSLPGATHGSDCWFISACPDGMICIGAEAHSNCANNIGCCSTVCDVTEAKDPCPYLDPAQSCEPWFVPGMAPKGYDHVGVCTVPL